MRSRDYLTELFNTKGVVWANKTMATFEVNGQGFVASFKRDAGGSSYYDFDFLHITDKGKSTFNNTGLTGAASSRVFGYAVECVETFIERVRPHSLGFIGFENDGRATLYSRMARVLERRFAPLGYTISSKPLGAMTVRRNGPGTQFTLTRGETAPRPAPKPAPKPKPEPEVQRQYDPDEIEALLASLQESVQSDRDYSQLAHALYIELYRYVYNDGELTHYDVNDTDMLGLPCKKLGVDPVFDKTLLFFKQGSEIRSASTHHLATPIAGADTAVIFKVRTLNKEGIENFLSTAAYVFQHEMIHVLDGTRYKVPFSDMQYTNPDENVSGYYNDPVEMNAYFHNLAEPLLDRLRGIKTDGIEYLELFDVVGATSEIPRDFRTYLTKIVQKRYPQNLKAFWDSLTEDNKRRLTKRLMKLFQEYWRLVDGGQLEEHAPTIKDATTKKGINRKTADRILDPKGYFHPKRPK